MFEPGTRLGRYELREVVGRGGMGVVYEAVLHGPAGFRKDVAIKVLEVGPGGSSEHSLGSAESPLVREARLGAMLSHPNLVSTLELGRSHGRWFVAMELVRGASVGELGRAGLPGSAVLDVGVQTCAALAHVHELRVDGAPAGLVHRDVKLRNLLVDRSGLVKLADLGVARLAHDRDGDAAGTVGYMAPEQLDGEAEPRSDLFSLGVVLYALATGRRPFSSGTDAVPDTLRVERRLADPAFLAPVDERVPGLGEVLRGCLRFDPADRWASAVELGRALRGLQARQQAGAPLTALLARVRPELVPDDDSASHSDSDAPTLKLPATPGPATARVRAPADDFVGRDALLHKVRALLDTHPLVTLHGPGGIGKTRVAVEVASRHAPSVLCDLSGAADEDAACVAVARALGVGPADTDPAGHLAAVLAERGDLLLILDTVEHLTAPVAALLARWLAAAPELRVLTTSRVPLRVADEHAVAVDPLSTDDAVALFEARATTAVTDRAVVEELVAELDRLPLALEIAAARTRLMGPSALLKRLSDRFRLLTSTRRDRPDRHATLRANIEASWELLQPWEQAALAQLSVLQTGFALETAERTLDLSRWPDAPWAVDVIEALVDHSLVRFDPDTERFSLYRSIAAFAAGQLDAMEGAREAAERRHGEVFARRGRSDALRALRHHGTAADRRTLLAEVPELITAAERAVARGDDDIAVDAACAALTVLTRSGPLPRALALADTVLDGVGAHRRRTTLLRLRALLHLDLGDGGRARADLRRAREVAEDEPRRTRALIDLGMLEASSGDTAVAREHLDQALAEAQALGDAELEAQARKARAVQLRHVGASEAAVAELDRAIELLRPLGSFDLTADLSNTLGNVYRVLGETRRARDAYQRALRWHRASGRTASEALVLANLATLDAERGRVGSGMRRIRRVLDLAQRTGDVSQLINTHATLGILLDGQGDYTEALAAYDRAIELARTLGDRGSVGTVLANAALLHLVHGHLPEAERALDEALELTRETRYRRFEGYALCTLGMLRFVQDRHDASIEALLQARAILEEVGDRRAVAAVDAEHARVELARGDLDAAEGLLDRAEPVLREIDDRFELAKALATRAELRSARGELEAARALVTDAQERMVRMGLSEASELGRRVADALAALPD